jgi:hypothetical protein
MGNLSGGASPCCFVSFIVQQPVFCFSMNTNHLDAEKCPLVRTTFTQYAELCAVTRDRYFLNNVAGWILELDRKKFLGRKLFVMVWIKNQAEWHWKKKSSF